MRGFLQIPFGIIRQRPECEKMGVEIRRRFQKHDQLGDVSEF